MPKVSVLIPAYNVSDKIRETLQAVQATNAADEIIVVDDCSPDNSGKIARECGASVITLTANRGKGGALTEGLKHCSGGIIVLLDGDLGSSASEFSKLLDPIFANEADMTIARFRPALKKGGFGFAKGMAAFTIRFHTGLNMLSPMSGQRAMTKQVASALGWFASGWEIETAMTIDVARMGFKIMEVPTDMTHSETGRDLKGFTHRFGQFRAVTRVFFSRIFIRRRPTV